MLIFKPHEITSILKQFLPSNPTIVEAGAFNGSDTKKMAIAWPEGTIHAFEPAPEIYKQLTDNTHTFNNIHTYQYALSDSDNGALFYVAEKPSKPGRATQAGSLHKPQDRLNHSPIIFPRTIEVPTITLESWMKKYNITDEIDLLWLDTQGHELPILKSILRQAQDERVSRRATQGELSRWATQGEQMGNKASQNKRVGLENIKVIFTEVAFIQAYEGQALYHEVVDWIVAQGFEYVGRDFENQTDSFFGNVLLVRK